MTSLNSHTHILDIVIVSWNTRQLLVNCIRSLEATTNYDNIRVIVVDNNSSDDSVIEIKRHFPSVLLIENKQNVGFAQASNQGIRASHSPYVLLLNSDTIIDEPSTLQDMLNYIEQNPSIGAAGCRLNFLDGSHQVGDAGYEPTLSHVFNHVSLLSRWAPSKLKGVFVSGNAILSKTEPVSVDWLMGAFFMVRRDILDTVGLLDENVFMYAEDIEWGCRMRQHGINISYLPWIQITHLQGASEKIASHGKISTRWLDNFSRLYWNWNNGKKWTLFKFAMFCGFFTRGILYALNGILLAKSKHRARSKEMFAFAFSSVKQQPPE